MVAPVCGFLPSRAALLETDQEPKPTRETRPPPLSVDPTLPRINNIKCPNQIKTHN